jgi:hypothetical protein
VRALAACAAADAAAAAALGSGASIALLLEALRGGAGAGAGSVSGPGRRPARAADETAGNAALCLAAAARAPGALATLHAADAVAPLVGARPLRTAARALQDPG